MQEFSKLIQYLQIAISIDIIAGDFKYDFLKVSENKFLNNLKDHVKIVNKPTQILGSLIDHFYIKKTLMEQLSTSVTVKNIYFLDHDAVKILFEKNAVDFHIIL